MIGDPELLAHVQQKMTVDLFHNLDFALTDAGNGWAEITLQISPRLNNPYGDLHGGMWTMIADSAMAAAIHTQLPPHERSATMQMDIRWLRAVPPPTLRVVGKVLRRGRRAWHTSAELFDSTGRLVGVAGGMFAVIDRDEPPRE